jgi:hypothetical protein
VEKKKTLLLNDKPIKIAIFGGSTAEGWGSAINFAQFIESSVFTGKNIIVHNYAKSAMPFVDFQAEILKAVISYYDVLIIYAGHNEWLGKIYSSTKNLSEPRILPNNMSFEHGTKSYDAINKRIKDFTEYGFQGYLKPHKINLNVIAERSRLSWFSYRVLNKIYSIIQKFTNKGQNIDLDNTTKLDWEEYEFKHYYPKKFFSSDERKSIVDDYKKTIIDIIKRLKPNQKLILSTVLSNNLFPPHADVLDVNDLAQIENYEKYANNSYKALLEEDYASLELLVNNLPDGPHKTYLQARNCLGSVWDSKLNNSNCLNLLEEVRKIDKWPIQIVPEINAFIRELKSENVLIADPVKILNNSDNFKDYNSYFVDYVHLSALGHYLIANEILIKLFNDYSEPTSFSLDACDNFTIQKKYKKFVLNPNSFHHYWTTKDRIESLWVVSSLTTLYSSEYYQYFLNNFKQKAIDKRNYCNIKY